MLDHLDREPTTITLCLVATTTMGNDTNAPSPSSSVKKKTSTTKKMSGGDEMQEEQIADPSAKGGRKDLIAGEEDDKMEEGLTNSNAASSNNSTVTSADGGGAKRRRELLDRLPKANYANFPNILYQLLEFVELSSSSKEDYQSGVSWDSSGASFRITCPYAFMKVCNLFFPNQSSFRSFERMLNVWGFKRLSTILKERSYFHPYFVRHQRHLLKRVQRRNNDTAKTSIRLKNGVRLNNQLKPELLSMQQAALDFMEQNTAKSMNKEKSNEPSPSLQQGVAVKTTTAMPLSPAVNLPGSAAIIPKLSSYRHHRYQIPPTKRPRMAYHEEADDFPTTSYSSGLGLGHGRRTRLPFKKRRLRQLEEDWFGRLLQHSRRSDAVHLGNPATTSNATTTGSAALRTLQQSFSPEKKIKKSTHDRFFESSSTPKSAPNYPWLSHVAAVATAATAAAPLAPGWYHRHGNTTARGSVGGQHCQHFFPHQASAVMANVASATSSSYSTYRRGNHDRRVPTQNYAPMESPKIPAASNASRFATRNKRMIISNRRRLPIKNSGPSWATTGMIALPQTTTTTTTTTPQPELSLTNDFDSYSQEYQSSSDKENPQSDCRHDGEDVIDDSSSSGATSVTITSAKPQHPPEPGRNHCAQDEIGSYLESGGDESTSQQHLTNHNDAEYTSSLSTAKSAQNSACLQPALS